MKTQQKEKQTAKEGKTVNWFLKWQVHDAIYAYQSKYAQIHGQKIKAEEAVSEMILAAKWQL